MARESGAGEKGRWETQVWPTGQELQNQESLRRMEVRAANAAEMPLQLKTEQCLLAHWSLLVTLAGVRPQETEEEMGGQV